VRKQLAEVLINLKVRSILDAGCGDFNWMKEFSLENVDYLGIDIVPDVIEHNNAKYASGNTRFLCADLTNTVLPEVDLILCREILQHLPLEDALRVIRNLCRSGSSYLLTTCYPLTTVNHDIVAGDWLAINLLRPPFNFPEPMQWVTEAKEWERLGLWQLRALPFL
jgi:SAM-dependent methyltransferase